MDLLREHFFKPTITSLPYENEEEITQYPKRITIIETNKCLRVFIAALLH